ncbi:MAG: acyloxyacyl hydrolase [Pseudomonadota bacterium]
MPLIRKLTLLLLAGCLLAAPLAVPAQAWILRPSEAGLRYFYNHSFDLDHGELVGSGLGFHLATPLHSGQWLRLDLELEVDVGGFANHDTGHEASLLPGLRVYLNPAGSWLPYLEGGFGVTYNDLGINELGTGFNFLSYAGLGLRLPLTGSTSLDLGYRLRHISNAGLDENNHGVTSHQAQAGLVWRF